MYDLKTIKLLQENIGETLQILVGNNFLGKNLKGQAKEAKIYNGIVSN
jgi:hypothetical protein